MDRLPQELQDEMIRVDAGIKGFDRTINKSKDNPKGWRLPDDLYEQYQKITAQIVTQTGTALMTSPQWQQMPDDEKRDLLRKAVTEAKKIAREYITKTKGQGTAGAAPTAAPTQATGTPPAGTASTTASASASASAASKSASAWPAWARSRKTRVRLRSSGCSIRLCGRSPLVMIGHPRSGRVPAQAL